MSITVVPPRHRSSRSRSRTPFDRDRSTSRVRHQVGFNSGGNVTTTTTSNNSVSHHVSGAGSYPAANGHTTVDLSDGNADRFSLRERYYRKKLLEEGDCIWWCGVSAACCGVFAFDSGMLVFSIVYQFCE